ncbi:MAG: acyl-ACP--UDP-N-acetylglucosamine O-acyltransferase [Rhizobiaceae bacterium]
MNNGASIHPLAVVEPGAVVGDGASIGPFCHIGAKAVIGSDVMMISHVTILGATTIGPRTRIFPNAVLGGPAQSTGHKGGAVTLTIGADCTIREGVTMHAGSDASTGRTVVGDGGNFLAYSHVAHDCIVGDNVTFANGATLGGHCEIGNRVNIGGMTAVHQFVRVGDHAFLGGASGIAGDVIPYGMAVGNRAKLRGFNIVGMKRSGMPRAEIHALRRAYRVLFDPRRPVLDNAEQVREDFADSASVIMVVNFLTSRGKRHFTVPPLGGATSADDDDAD